ncbi:metallophosphoesterase [Butyrivibrio sp. AC2005]|uniref:metallophosphoesterase n=1 Tax=Butyrivibrio sp. AC2005 TaxID=1280672 RepID=UPI000402D09E|nr:metallophosphoesterase [Butyrivibrio sp. AC2005]
MKKKSFIKRIIIAIIIILIAATAWFEVPVTEHINIDSSGKLTNPVRVALITDLHSCYYGDKQKTLTKMIDKENVDAVFLAGDIFDDRMADNNSKALIEQIAPKYPCYYVVGNHEYWSGRLQQIKDYMISNGVTVLEGTSSELAVNGNIIDVSGVDDPTDMSLYEWEKQMESASTTSDNFKILLSHRPEGIEIYKKYDFDLVVTGHAHGGQWRIPFTGYGMYAPDQGLLPKYVDGVYDLSDKAKMVVSRGLARERMPFPRFFNHPEIVIIEID